MSKISGAGIVCLVVSLACGPPPVTVVAPHDPPLRDPGPLQLTVTGGPAAPTALKAFLFTRFASDQGRLAITARTDATCDNITDTTIDGKAITLDMPVSAGPGRIVYSPLHTSPILRWQRREDATTDFARVDLGGYAYDGPTATAVVDLDVTYDLKSPPQKVRITGAGSIIVNVCATPQWLGMVKALPTLVEPPKTPLAATFNGNPTPATAVLVVAKDASTSHQYVAYLGFFDHKATCGTVPLPAYTWLDNPPNLASIQLGSTSTNGSAILLTQLGVSPELPGTGTLQPATAIRKDFATGMVTADAEEFLATVQFDDLSFTNSTTVHGSVSYPSGRVGGTVSGKFEALVCNATPFE